MDFPVRQWTGKIDTPGVYDMSSSEYHADPVPGGSLSSSGARLILSPSCPAKFIYEIGRESSFKPEFNMGHAAHRMVLGEGNEITLIDEGDWKKKSAREARDAAVADSRIPMLHHEYAGVCEMARVVHDDPFIGKLLACDGITEKSFFWDDRNTGVTCRAMLDAVRVSPSGRLVVVDYKTSRSADPVKFSKAAVEYGYHIQAAWYLDSVWNCLGVNDAMFLFVVQEKEAPYLFSVVEFDPEAIRIGEYLSYKARCTYRECKSSGVWPGYVSDGTRVSLPYWYASEIGAEMQKDGAEL